MMERRKIDILCVQETKRNGSKARNIGGGFKIFYHGLNERRNGVSVVLKEQLIKYVLKVQGVLDRMVKIKVEVKGKRRNIVSAYAPQVRCNLKEKEAFGVSLMKLCKAYPKKSVIIEANLNNHVGSPVALQLRAPPK